MIPTLHTARLTLRPPQMADFEHRAASYASDRRAAWRLFASEVGQWPLVGFGPFSVDLRATGAYVGEVGIYQPEGYPSPDLGWFVAPHAEGNGYAFEAARAVMLWARQSFGWDHLVNYIDPRNARSIALGLRLGGQRADLPGVDATDVVILHDLRGLA